MVANEIGTSNLLRTWANAGTKTDTDGVTIVGGAIKTDVGWQAGEKPPYQFLNDQMNKQGQKINHCLQNGVPLWNSTTTYTAGNMVTYSSDAWLCITENMNSAPTLLNSNWVRMTKKNELEAQNLMMLKLIATPIGVPVSTPTVKTLQVPAGLKVPNDARTDLIEFNSNITIDVSSGTGLNKLDTGTIQANSVYYLWLLKNPTTSTVGAVLSLSSTSPTLPSGMSLKRLYPVSFPTDASANFYLQTIISHRVSFFKTPITIYNGAVPTTNFSSPDIINLTGLLSVNALLADFNFWGGPGGGSGQINFYPSGLSTPATNLPQMVGDIERGVGSKEILVDSTRSYKLARQIGIATYISVISITYAEMT